MLNYIWAGMILLSIVFSLGHDISDEINNRYQNGDVYSYNYESLNLEELASVQIEDSVVHFSIDDKNQDDLVIPVSEELSPSWLLIADKQTSKNKQQLRAEIISIDKKNKIIEFRLPEVHWVKIRAITDAAFDMAKFAVKLAIGLAGIMALWLGLMRIAEKSGLIAYFVRLLFPILHWLFPAIDKNDPVLGSISLNMAANILGLGNAATPMGIKAMQQLQVLNQKKDTASDEMCMFLAINNARQWCAV